MDSKGLTLGEIESAIAASHSPQHGLRLRLAQELLSSRRTETKLREALQYIVDHNWVAGATPVKWINEFVDVAKVALEEDSVATGQQLVNVEEKPA